MKPSDSIDPDSRPRPSKELVFSISDFIRRKSQISQSESGPELSDDSSSSSVGKQLFATLAATLASAALGGTLGWTATSLPSLRESGDILIDAEAEKWIAPLALLGAAISCPFGGYSIDRLGRQKTLVYLMPFCIAGWICLGLAQNIVMIYIGRFVTGFCNGVSSIAIPIYITEISDCRLRGALTSGFDLMTTVGILYIFIIGAYLDWRTQAFLCCFLPGSCLLLLLFVPESPRYLIGKGRMADGEKALRWFSPSKTTEQIHKKAEQLSQVLLLECSNGNNNTKCIDEESSIFTSNWLSAQILKPIWIGLALMFFQQACGIFPITFYTVDIFHSSGTDINENLSTIIVGSVQVVATIVAAGVVDKSGRRFLLILSSIFVVVSLIGLGIFYYVKKMDGEMESHLHWLPLTSLMVFVVAFSIGLGPIPWLYMGEILPPRVRGIGAGLITCWSNFLGFIVALYFGGLMELIGNFGVYWFYAGCTLVGGIYILFCVPETKGKTLEEVQLYFVPKTIIEKQNKLQAIV